MIAIFNAAKTNYALAVDNGFVGTLEEYLASLQGPPGLNNVPNPENLCRFEINGDQTMVTLMDLASNPITEFPYIPPA